jgi:hypothetical protein
MFLILGDYNSVTIINDNQLYLFNGLVEMNGWRRGRESAMLTTKMTYYRDLASQI